MTKVGVYSNYSSLDAALANSRFARTGSGIFSSFFANENPFKRGTWVKVLLDICSSLFHDRSYT